MVGEGILFLECFGFVASACTLDRANLAEQALDGADLRISRHGFGDAKSVRTALRAVKTVLGPLRVRLRCWLKGLQLMALQRHNADFLEC